MPFVPAGAISIGTCITKTGTVSVPVPLDESFVFVQSVSLSGQNIEADGVFFRTDGLRVYTLHRTPKSVFGRAISPAWSIDPLGGQQSKGIATTSHGLFFRADGLRMYVSTPGPDNIHEYAMTVAWDLDTLSLTQAKNISAQDNDPNHIFFKPDGLQAYVAGGENNVIYQFSLSVAWDISTMTIVRAFNVSAQTTILHGVSFDPTGARMYIGGRPTPIGFYRYNLSTPWNISTAVFDRSFDTSAQVTAPAGIYIRADELKVYMQDFTTNSLFEYDIIPSSSGDKKELIGEGTLFSTELTVGDTICLGDERKVIDSITNNTTLFVETAVVGTFVASSYGKFVLGFQPCDPIPVSSGFVACP